MVDVVVVVVDVVVCVCVRACVRAYVRACVFLLKCFDWNSSKKHMEVYTFLLQMYCNHVASNAL